MKKFAVMNQKGGVGKSTAAINIAAILASRGHRTLLVEMDKQGNASRVVSGGLRNEDFEVSIDDVFTKGKKVSMGDAIYDSEYNNLHYCPATSGFQNVLDQCISRLRREYILSDELDKLSDIFEYVVIDTPPNLGLGAVNSILAADHYLVPLAGDDFSIEGLTDMLEVLNEMRISKPLSVFRNIYHASNTIVNGVINEALDEAIEGGLLSEGDVLKTVVRQREVVKHANVDRKPLMHYSPKADVNDDFNALVDELLAKVSV